MSVTGLWPNHGLQVPEILCLLLVDGPIAFSLEESRLGHSENCRLGLHPFPPSPLLHTRMQAFSREAREVWGNGVRPGLLLGGGKQGDVYFSATCF